MSQYTDLIARLRVKDSIYTEFWQQKLMDEAADALEARQAERDAIDALHQPDDESPPNCAHCSYKWPCPDHRILHPGEPT